MYISKPLLILTLLALPLVNLIGQDNSVEDRKLGFSASFGARFGGDYEFYATLVTTSILMPRRKRNFIEVEARYYQTRMHWELPTETVDIGGYGLTVIRPELLFKYDFGLRWKFLSLYINPYAYLFYEGMHDSSFYLADSSATTYWPINSYSGGIGLGIESRGVIHFSNHFAIFSGVNFSVIQTAYVSTEVMHNSSTGSYTDRMSFFALDIFNDAAFWTFGLMWTL